MVKWVRLVQSLIFGIGYLHMGLALGALGPTIQPLASQLHVSLSQMGWMFAARGIGADQLPKAAVDFLPLDEKAEADRAARVAQGTGPASPGLVRDTTDVLFRELPSFAWVVAAHFLTGVGVGCSDTGGNVLLVWLWEGDSMLTAAMQFLHACFGAGSVMVGVVAANFSVTSTYLLMALSVGASTALTLSIAHIPIVPKSQQDDADAAAAAAAADATKEQLATRDGDETLDKQAPETTDATAPTSGPTQGGGRETEVVVFISIMLLLLVGIEVAFGGMIGVYSTRMLGMSESAAAYVTAVFWLSFTGMRIVSIVVVMFVSEPTLITLNSLGSVLSALVLVVFPFEAWAMYGSASPSRHLSQLQVCVSADSRVMSA